MKKEILYLDMDNVLVNFQSGIHKIDPAVLVAHEAKHGRASNGEVNALDEIPGIFALMDPLPGAVEAVRVLANHFDVYVLSSAPWNNSSAWADKLIWIKRHFGENKDSPFFKKLILSSHKELNIGGFLVDDRLKKGAQEFGQRQGSEHIHFGQPGFENWSKVLPYLLAKAKVTPEVQIDSIDLAQPLFAYGHLKQGQLAHNQIAALVDSVEPASLQGFQMYVADGTPFAVPSPQGQVSGQLLAFKEPEEAYRRISAFELREGKNYSWVTVKTDGGAANALVSSKPLTRSDKESNWDVSMDPYFGSLIPRNFRSFQLLGKDKFAPENFLDLQANFAQTWTLLERTILFREGRTVHDYKTQAQLNHIWGISEWQNALEMAEIDRKVAFRSSSNSHQAKPLGADKNPFSAWYQARNNIVHRGKSAAQEVRSLRRVAIDLHNVLAIILQTSSSSLSDHWRKLSQEQNLRFEDYLFVWRDLD